MKYWLYLAAKVIAAVVFTFALQTALIYVYPRPRIYSPAALSQHYLVFMFIALGVWLVGAGLIFVAIWDQRRRCRTCLRRLIMPLKTGSWGHIVLLGRPTTEMICPFGHGTLYIEELQLVGHQYRDWHAHDGDIWKELESYDQAGSNRG